MEKFFSSRESTIFLGAQKLFFLLLNVKREVACSISIANRNGVSKRSNELLRMSAKTAILSKDAKDLRSGKSLSWRRCDWEPTSLTTGCNT